MAATGAIAASRSATPSDGKVPGPAAHVNWKQCGTRSENSHCLLTAREAYHARTPLELTEINCLPKIGRSGAFRNHDSIDSLIHPFIVSDIVLFCISNPNWRPPERRVAR
jgi:hypothetical protein